MIDDVDTATGTTLPAGSSGVEARKPEPKIAFGDRYQVGRRIGTGGMGEVYAARDTHLGREVAIKVVRPRLGPTGGAQDRLVREARAMAKLRHANVVTLHDIGTAGDQTFIVMELVQGGTLAEWLKAQPRSWREIIALFLQAARGLAAAHTAGFVHLDFKPENVLVGIDGVVRVTDFGVVRLVGNATSAAATSAAVGVEAGTGRVVGTPGYIAPEILRHEGVDARADQFSFCVALYAALYDERPFERQEGSSRITETLGRPRLPPRSRGPQWLARIVTRGLSASPAERFPTIDALASAIEDRLRRPRRQRAMAVAAAAIAIVVVLATRPTQPPHVLAPRVLFRDSELQRSRVEDISRDGRTLIFSAPGEVWLSPRDGAGRKQLQLPFSTSLVYNVVSIPDAPQRVVAELWTEHQGLGMWELTRDAVPVRRHSGTTQLLDVRADGTILGIAGEVGREQLVLLDRFGHEPRILQSVEGAAAVSARFSPGGGRVGYIAFQGPFGRVAVIELATGTVAALDAKKSFRSLAWLDDQKLVAVERGDGLRRNGIQTDPAASHIVEIGVSGGRLRSERSLRVEQRGTLSLVRITSEGTLMRANWTDRRLALVVADGSEATTAGAVLSRDHQLDSLVAYTDSGIVYQATRADDSFVVIQRSDQTVELMDSARGLGTPLAAMADGLLFVRRQGDSQSLIRLTERGSIVLGMVGGMARVVCAGDRQEPCVIGERLGEKWQIRGLSAKMGIDARILAEASLDQFPNQPALSLDGRTLAYGTNGGKVGFFDLETGTTHFEEWQEPSGTMPIIETLTWETPSSLVAAECCSPSRVVRLTLGGPRTVLATSDTLRYRSPRLAPDGRTVAVEAQSLDQTYLWIPELRTPK